MILATLLLTSVSQTQKAAAAPTTIYNITTVCDQKTFQNTGNNIISFTVDMPESRSYAWIYASGQSYGDGYSRLFELYVNGVRVSGQQYPYNSFSYSWNILSYLHTGSNTIGIKLTTYTYSPNYNQYWLVSSRINVQYTDSNYIKTSQDWFAPYVEFQNTGNTILNFTAVVPNGLANGATIWLGGTDYNDGYWRRLDVFVNDQAVTPSGGVTIYPYSFSWSSPDLTSRLAFQKTVKIGVRLTTYTYSPNYNQYWRVSGVLYGNARYEVWPDADPRWNYNWHPVGNGGATMYDTLSSDHMNQFLGPTSFELKVSAEHTQLPIFYAGVMTEISDAMQHKYDLPWYTGINDGLFIEDEFHITVRDHNGNLVPNVAYHIRDAETSPTDTGTDLNEIGSDMLGIISVVAGAIEPAAAIPPAIAAVLVKYLPQSGMGFSYGKETSTQGVYLSDHRGVLQKLSDTLAFDVNLPAMDTYTINFSLRMFIYNMVTFYWGGGTSYFLIAQNIFSYTTTYYYGA